MDIGINCMGIRASCNQHGRIDIDDDCARHGEPPRYADILAGRSNLGIGNVIVLGADGNPTVLSQEANDRMVMPDGSPSVGWDVKTVTGANENEHLTEITLGAVIGDGKFDVRGAKSFAPLREERDTLGGPGEADDRHWNVFHAMYTGVQRGKAYFRQWRIDDSGVRRESDWFGPIPFGSQA